MKLDYSDYIAHLVANGLKKPENDFKRLLSNIVNPRYDLNEEGSLMSSKKTVEVTDSQGKRYRIIIEAM